MAEFNQGRAIVQYAYLMELASMGAYDERDESGNDGADGIEESLDNLIGLAAKLGLQFIWHEHGSTYTLEPMSAEDRAVWKAATEQESEQST